MQPETDTKKQKVLLVERDSDTADIYVALFSYLGYETRAVASPMDALIWAERLQPEIIFSSLVFQDMHGFEFATRVRKLPGMAHALMFALTGMHYPGIDEAAKAAGFDGYLLKPVTMEAFVQTLDAHSGKLQQKMQPTPTART